MALRCLLFSADEAAAEPIREILAGLGIEGDFCPEALDAAERISTQSFQLVIVDWEQQPDAASLIRTTRDRKASERPLVIAIVSDDASVPKAMQAGANSVLRRPIVANQAKDTLTTARDLLRAKKDAATQVAQAAAAKPAGAPLTLPKPDTEKTLRAGEFLQTSTLAPGAQFETESVVAGPAEESVDPLKDLEPVAAAVAEAEPAPSAAPATPAPDEPKGLEWYLKNRAGISRAIPGKAEEPTPPAAPDKPEILGFDQTPSVSGAPTATASARNQTRPDEHKAEEKLFAYMEGEEEETKKASKSSFRLGKGAVAAALVLAGVSIVAAPQAPWHPQLKVLWKRQQQNLHTWLNPQPVVSTAQAPESHETFNRAGDEYKLPVAEPIPDATTDPSQIQVLPAVDPTKKTNGSTDANAAPTDASGATPANNNTNPGQPQVQVQENGANPAQGAADSGNAGSATATVSSPAVNAPSAALTAPAPTPVANPVAAPVSAPPSEPVVKHATPQYVAAPERVPSSLKSQMVSMTPDASGNRAPETAMQAIEPVAVAEAAERQLVADQPAIAYPANANGRQGIVVLQVLIGRDGGVQDAKFQQGSLAFAKVAIDGIKQWKFKPYMMNGRAVSVQTTMTMSFKPGS